MNFFRDLFSDLVDVIIRNLSLSPDDVQRLQEIEQTFRNIGNKIADNVREQTEDALDNIRDAFTSTFESIEKRLHDVEDKIDALSEQPTKPEKPATKTTKSTKG